MMTKARISSFLLISVISLGVLAGQELIDAVRKGDRARVHTILDRDPGLANAADRYTLGPLHWAALDGDSGMVDLLLKKGAAIDQRTRLDRTAFNIALQHGHRDVADLLATRGADQAPWKWPRIVGDYLGEELPGAVPRLLSPEILSSVESDHGAPAFTRDGNEVFWAVVFKDDTGILLSMKREGGVWREIKPLPFAESRFRDVCPTLSSDEKSLFFTSCRPVRTGEKPGGHNMWVVDRKAGGGWTEPRLLAPEIASGKDGRPVFAGNGTVYFGSWREGAIDSSNLFRSRWIGGGFEKPERLNVPSNTSQVMPTYVAPDESLILFESALAGGLGGSDFWMIRKEPGGAWGPAINLGEPINSRANDWFGGFSPDAKYFFFVSDRNGNNDVYWIDAKVVFEARKPISPLASR